ncbi:hypothetical protein POM88_044487 [Heracleum sosnowskyi]|uniref:Uncharacterized protein n=1 Tax=Heracleum sosnowskyi TaxID=360622 RepID=A0AAD8H5A7_9APIA|nr:hypothetical protein POM88_044487 [Heracleum sosnowskyi]
MNNVVLRVVFSKKRNYGEEKGKSGISEFSDIIDDSIELLSAGNIAELFPWMRWYNKLNGIEARLEKNFKALDSFYDMVIQEHSRGPEHEDLVDVLLHVQNDPNQEIRLANDNIKGVLTDSRGHIGRHRYNAWPGYQQPHALSLGLHRMARL